MTSDFVISEYLTAPDTTVQVGQSTSHPNIVLMKWQQDVETGDVADAFEQINTLLDESATPLYIMVDILSKPKFPMSETIMGAMRGPYRHENLTAWLVVGDNRMARMIEKVLASVTRRKNVEWFESMADALDFVTQQPA